MSEAIAVREEVNVFALFDKLDDELILAELENRVANTWCYHFSQQGQEVWGLSKKGVDQALMELEKQGLVYDEPIVTIQADPTDPEYVLFFSNIRKFRYDREYRKIDMGSVSGYKRQCVKMKNGTDDPFWFEKGAAKATRNAKSRTIPIEIETKIIALAKREGKVKTVEEEPEADGLITEHRTEAVSPFATDKQRNWIKGLVKEKLDDDWADFCVRFKFQTKQEAFDTMTVKMASGIIETLKSMKNIASKA